MDVFSKYRMALAWAQKNSRASRVSLVIILDDLSWSADLEIPGMPQSRRHAEDEFCCNTPSTSA